MKDLMKTKFIKWFIGLITFEIFIVIIIMTILMSFVGVIVGNSESVSDDDYLSALKVRQAQIFNHTNVDVDLSIHYAIDQVNRDKPFKKDPYVHIGEDDVACFISSGSQIKENNFEDAFTCMDYTKKEQNKFNYYYGLYNENASEVVTSNLGFSYPVKDPYVITAGFNSTDSVHNGKHDGVDFVALNDKSVLSSSGGVVSSANNDCPQMGYLGSTCGYGFGNHVVVQTKVEDVNYKLIYGHMSEVNVKVGDKVSNGQVIGIMGQSGNVTGAHVHLQIEKEINGVFLPVDPMPLLQASIIDSDNTKIMSDAGIAESDYEYVDYIVSHESSWDYQAENASSGAYGLCQALPGNKMASSGSDWKTNPITQMKWCNSYATSRYGSWKNAQLFWKANQWW